MSTNEITTKVRKMKRLQARAEALQAEINGESYFIGKDVAEVLGYTNTRDALAKHVDDEDKNTVAICDGIGNPNKIVINESGLYSLILSSKLQTAKAFKAAYTALYEQFTKPTTSRRFSVA